MAIRSLHLRDFRCFEDAALRFVEHGVTVIRGPNGAGKTSVLEAVAWLATGRSWRSSGREHLVRDGATEASLRAELVHQQRPALLQATVPIQGTARTILDGQPVRNRRTVVPRLRIVICTPSDVRLVTDGPSERRDLLDDLLVLRSPRGQAVRRELERCLRQRGALLQQLRGRLDAAGARALDVWDQRLAEIGTAMGELRRSLVEELGAHAGPIHARLAPGTGPLRLVYRSSWEGDLQQALWAAREEDLRRQTTSVGPHRDELDLMLGTRPARTEASQGEQRGVALALRLASFWLLAGEPLEPPVLLLDDVFAELDEQRRRALVGELPQTDSQVLLTATSAAPKDVPVAAELVLRNGHVEDAAA